MHGSLEWYGQLWDNAELTDDLDDRRRLNRAVKKIQEHQMRYQMVERKAHVPWWVIAVIHMREADCDFRSILHNGERIIGTGEKTRLVPKARGPFATWEEAAVDALNIIRKPEHWTIERTLQFLEKYNGTGYLRYHPETLSPYLWACTTLYSGFGKYVADGKFDPRARELQCGVVAMIIKLQILVGRE